MSSTLRLKPACQGQAPGHATSPPTMRLGFLMPQVSGVSCAPRDGLVVAGKEGGGVGETGVEPKGI